MATYDNTAMQQNETPSHLEMAAADQYYLKTDLLREYPNLLPTYFKQGGKQFSTMDFLNVLQFGRLNKTASDSPYTGHWEKPITKTLIHVGSITAGDSGSEAVITLDASDMYTVNNGAGQTYPKSMPRVKDTLDSGVPGLKFQITAKDKTVNPNTITIKSNDGSDPLDAIAEGDVLNVFANVSGEYTGQNSPLQPLRYRYQNTFWISKETDMISGSHLTTKVAFNVVPGSNKLYLEGMEDMEERSKTHKGNVFMFGSQATNWTEYSQPMDEDVTIPGTEGLFDAVSNNGYNMNYDETDFGLNDLRELTNYYQSINISTTDILLLEGITARQILEDGVRDLINYNWCIGISDAYIMKGRKEQWGAAMGKDYNPDGMFLNMGVNGFVLDGYTFMQKGCPEFNNDFGAGAVGNYKKTIIAAPIGFARDAEHTPYTGYEYRGTDGYSRENEVWFKAGAGNSGVVGGKAAFYKTSQYDGVSYYIRWEIAPHFSLLNQFSILKPGAVSS